MILLYLIISFCALPTPQRLIKPGIVVLGSRKCNYTQKIIDRLTAEGKPFTIEYIDNDKELNNYIVDEHKGGIPIVFENGVYQGTGKEYLNKQDGGNSQPVEPTKQQPVPQPVEPTKPQPVPQ
ncbi:hypothetical protein NBO_100gi001 [Nosema bombycis CQ1]|uniref:Glutaredoxin domain-containing protein n=1 Tax=Nosema bombycis (strain CQ1 / CVCC 102059) TaxID=578461 RepID=R0KSN3_NOSB1|nr:hypothetical protein NBO_100gi001 [Nosema bombycis CQ1]|eukprot:EOB13227.1 hypothetical protein NBO_100gi001 [Nosema bombycis CQ1]